MIIQQKVSDSPLQLKGNSPPILDLISKLEGRGSEIHEQETKYFETPSDQMIVGQKALGQPYYPDAPRPKKALLSKVTII